MMNKLPNKKAEIVIQGDISAYGSWWEDVVTAKSFKSQLDNLGDVEEIDVKINSDGGDPVTACAIYNLLREHPAKINTYVLGMAASAASVIFMAGDKRYMAKTSFLMIHNPSSFVGGTAEELRNVADTLDTIRDGVLTAYLKSGLSENEIKELLDKETWMTGEMALEKGFATELTNDDVKMVYKDDLIMLNNVKFNMSRCKEFKNFLMKAEIKLKKEEEEMINSIEDLKTKYPEMYNEIVATAKQEGVVEERARMSAIDEIAMEGAEEIIFNAKYKEPKSASEVSMILCKAMKEGTLTTMKKTVNVPEEPKKEVEMFNNKKLDAQISGAEEVLEGGDVTLEMKNKSLAEKIAMRLNNKRGL